MKPYPNAQTEGVAAMPLSKKQKRNLALIARKAWKVAGAPQGEKFEDWRHAEQEAAVGIASLRDCQNRHYLPLQAHFLALAGQRAAAARSAIAAVHEPRTWALNKLERTCREVADVLPDARGYVAGFLRNTYRTTIEAASPDVIWKGIWTLIRRAGQLRRKARGEAGRKKIGERGTESGDRREGASRQDSIPAGGGAGGPDVRAGSSRAIRGVPRGEKRGSEGLPDREPAGAGPVNRIKTHLPAD